MNVALQAAFPTTPPSRICNIHAQFPDERQAAPDQRQAPTHHADAPAA
jgi:hypothetical protein